MSVPIVTAIVLAGGRSSRYGAAKLEAQIDGTPLLALSIRAAASAADNVLVLGPELPSSMGNSDADVRLVSDEHPFDGPLVALAGALPEASGELVIVVGGDMPGLVPAVLRAMLDRLIADPSIDAVTLADPGFHPDAPPHRAVLPLALRVASALDVAPAAVRSGDRSLVRLLGRLRSIEIPAADWLPLDPRVRTLLDVDLPADLIRIANELH